MADKKSVFIEKLSKDVENRSDIPGEIDEIILDLIGKQEVCRKEIYYLDDR